MRQKQNTGRGYFQAEWMAEVEFSIWKADGLVVKLIEAKES